MAKQPERALVEKIRAAVKKRRPDAMVIKLADRYRRGLPDLMIIWHNAHESWFADTARFLFVEAKTSRGKLSPLQNKFKADLLRSTDNSSRFRFVVARSVEDVMELVG